MPTLLDLPSDILFDEIFTKLSWPSISSCLSTCRTLRDRINVSQSLSYRKELCLSAMIDNPMSSIPLAEKLEKLKIREGRWSQFVPRAVSVAAIPEDNEGHYEVQDGLYILGRKNPDETMTSVFGWRLPADEDLIHEDPVWEDLIVDAQIIDFGLSVDVNDLIVFGCHSPPENGFQKISVHLRQWSTKAPHPQATCPILETSCLDADPERALASLRVAGDILIGVFRYCESLHQGTYSSRLFVWNWKTGERGNDILVTSPGAFFLREDIIAVPNPLSFALDIYIIPPVDSSDSTPSILFFMRLSFPTLSTPGPATVYIQTNVEPGLTRSPPRNLPPSRPFSADPVEAIVYFSIIIDTTQESSSYALLVHRQTLLDLALSALGKRGRRHIDITSCEWEAWGPENCRMFDTADSDNPFMTCVHGTRFASLTSSEDHTRPGALEILNFNRFKVRRAQLLARDGKRHDVRHQDEVTKLVSTLRLVDRKEKTVVKSKLFKDDVVTTLPYLCTTVLPWDNDVSSQPGKRARMARWMNKRLHVPIPQSVTPIHFEWEGVMLSEQCFIGTITGASESSFLPESVEVFHFG